MKKKGKNGKVRLGELIKDLSDLWDKYELPKSKKTEKDFSIITCIKPEKSNKIKEKSINPTFNYEPELEIVNYDKLEETIITNFFNQGLNFYNNGEKKKAINCFKLVLNLDPENEDCKKYIKEAQKKTESNKKSSKGLESNKNIILPGEVALAKMMGTNNYVKKSLDMDSVVESTYLLNDNFQLLLPKLGIGEKIIQEMMEKGYFPQDYVNLDMNNGSNDNILNDKSLNYLLNGNQGLQGGMGSLIKEITNRLEAEEKLRVLSSAIEQLKEGITVSGIDGKLMFVNNAFATMHGYDIDKILGKPISTFNTYGQIKILKNAKLQNNINEAKEGENWHVKSDGTVFPILTKNSIFYDDNGQPIGLIGTHLDITKLKKSEEQIRKLGLAVEQSIDGIAIFDLEMKLTYVNDSFAKIYGYSPKEMIGMRVEQLHTKKQQKLLTKEMDKVKDKGSWKGEIGSIRKDGSYFPSFISVTLIKDSKGIPVGTLSIIKDITKRKRMEKKLERYSKHLEEEIKQRTNELIQSEKMASLGQLVDGVAHEINNPLEYITLNTEMIDEYLKDLEVIEDPEVQRKIKEIGQLLTINNKGINKIIETSRTLTRFALPNRRSKLFVDINQGIKDTLNIFYNKYKYRIKIHENYGELPEIKCNIEQLNQAFMNIFLNSSQAMDQGDIWIRTRKYGNNIIIEIEDNGCGIPECIINKIFDPFFCTKKDGAGLGLSLSYRIIQAHNGVITVKSKEHEGTLIKIKLPLVRNHERSK
jgi:PAS domain S-box-containing protein